MVGGSNPHDKYVFTNVLYPTALRLEAFSWSYLDSNSSSLCQGFLPKAKTKIHFGKKVAITFTVTGPVDLNSVIVTMVSPLFNTHSFSMNQRLLVLDGGNSTTSARKSWQHVHEVTLHRLGIIYYLWLITKFQVQEFGSECSDKYPNYFCPFGRWQWLLVYSWFLYVISNSTHLNIVDTFPF